MKTLKIATVAAFVSLLGFSQTTDAAPPRAKIAKKTKLAFKTDLRCSIKGYYDAAGTKPIANGGHTINLDEMYVRITVENAGRLSAKGFTSSANVIKDGSSVYSNSQTFDLPPGFSMSFPLVKVDTHHSSLVKATLAVDTGKGINELNEKNNVCRFSVKSNKLH